MDLFDSFFLLADEGLEWSFDFEVSDFIVLTKSVFGEGSCGFCGFKLLETAVAVVFSVASGVC